MNVPVTLKNTWVQKQNYIKKLRKILTELYGQGLKTLAFSALLTYWAIIILATFLL